jgi:UDP-N-acetylmuramoyl-L-alanyl-D-glutamate--2,6-diaminopimelate ligase
MIHLSTLLDALGELLVEVQGASHDTQIGSIAYDSRQVSAGSLFVAVEGFKSDGHAYLGQALSQGAAAVVVRQRDRVPLDCRAVIIEVRDTRRALALLSAASVGWPGKQLTMVGITGTNGKTTTTILVEGILQAAGRSPGLMGTMFNRVGGVAEEARNTTPESLDLQLLLARMREVGHDSVVMEVSSHGLALDRTVGCAFDVGVFTNLTQDHLDFHKDMEDYFGAKRRLFDDLGVGNPKPGPRGAVINLDDAYGPRVLKACTVPTWTYGLSEQAQVQASAVEHLPSGVRFALSWPGGTRRVHLRLCGLFNVYNALAAFATALALEIPAQAALDYLEQASPVRGRFETVHATQPFRVLVDYAHTPDGLDNVLRAARAITQGRLLVVFGCGGDRDNRKRPIMGELATTLADQVVITSDNPRSEPPEQILAQVAQGAALGAAPYEVITDRRTAIEAALRAARPTDTVVIAGKGHETYQILADRTIDFDDVQVAHQALEQLGYGGHS